MLIKRLFIVSFSLLFLHIYAENEQIIERIQLGDYAYAEVVSDVTRAGGIEILYHLLQPACDLIKDQLSVVKNNPYKNTKASVRKGSAVSPAELKFRQMRFAKIKKAQKNFLAMDLADEDVLEVAISCSGGGWRAMTSSYGFLRGAEKIQLLDCVMYLAGLSGSTWLLNPYLVQGGTLEDYEQTMLQIWPQGLMPLSEEDIGEILIALCVKLAYGQPVGVVDLYGALLGNTLLQDISEKQQTICMSMIADRIKNGDYPMPINTALLGDHDMNQEQFEFTPYEMGTRWLCGGCWIPKWSCGREFRDSISVNYAPEASLASELGIWGSAFSASLREIYIQMINDMKPGILSEFKLDFLLDDLKKIIKMIIETELGDVRLLTGKIRNPLKGYKAAGIDNPLKDRKAISLVDAGLAFGNPVFATYRKPPYGGAPDVIIVLDASATTVSLNEMDMLVEYAKAHNLDFPVVKNSPQVRKQALTAFYDKNNPATPVIIYMPIVRDEALFEQFGKESKYKKLIEKIGDFDFAQCMGGDCGTFQLSYTTKFGLSMAGLTEFNMCCHESTIRDLMIERINLKRA